MRKKIKKKCTNLVSILRLAKLFTRTFTALLIMTSFWIRFRGWMPLDSSRSCRSWSKEVGTPTSRMLITSSTSVWYLLWNDKQLTIIYCTCRRKNKIRNSCLFVSCRTKMQFKVHQRIQSTMWFRWQDIWKPLYDEICNLYKQWKNYLGISREM